MKELFAHLSEDKQRWQTLYQHCKNVEVLCRKAAVGIKLENLAAVIGLLHDCGKATQSFQNYLNGQSEHPNHAVYGAKYAYEAWFHGELIQKRTACIISMCITGHHAGLQDVLNLSGNSPFLDGLKDCNEALYIEAKTNFTSVVASAETLNELFLKACDEVAAFAVKKSFVYGLLARLMLSILVDSDRWDAACFEYGTDPLHHDTDFCPPWKMLLAQLEKYVENLSMPGDTSELTKARKEISANCSSAGLNKPGIYTLSVPTGGGKTLSSLRYALTHAASYGCRRIFYVIPFNTILDQNAKDIRAALNGFPSILEHHSNVVVDQNDTEAQKNYRRMSERWDSDIILTSLVQFMNALFRKKNSDTRRMWRLTNAILIFDEIQSLPKKCRKLFEQGIQFLVRVCGCTVVLCTATQPGFALDPTPTEITPDKARLYQQLKRVKYCPELMPQSYEQAAQTISAWVAESTSVLAIVNTKRVAWEVFNTIRQNLTERGIHFVSINPKMTEAALKRYAEDAASDTVLCVHLSTNMCPAHRRTILRYILAWQRAKKPVCCISTALIEAGINVSFPVVVRSLAGLPSIVQAAGRCNRNCEDTFGTVYVWMLRDENLKNLPEIKQGQEISRELLRDTTGENCDLSLPALMDQYFKIEIERSIQVRENLYAFPYKEWSSNLVEMLSKNKICNAHICDLDPTIATAIGQGLCSGLRQSFRTAGTAFQVIDQQTYSVIVPYEQGKELIAQLCGRLDQQAEIKYLRQAQQYCVNLYSETYERLRYTGAIQGLGETGAFYLKEEYYDTSAGVIMMPNEMELIAF